MGILGMPQKFQVDQTEFTKLEFSQYAGGISAWPKLR